jgi:hypothetical protein
VLFFPLASTGTVVVAVEALGSEHVIPDQFNQRRQSCSAGADPVRKVDTSSSTLSRA